MKISKNEVVAANLDFIKGFVPDIRTGDAIKLIVERVGSKVTVDPDSVEAESVKVEFKPDMVIAVSKGATLNEIVSLIATATQGGIGALGTHPLSNMAPINGIAGATVQTLNEIMNTVQSQGNVNLSATASLETHEEPEWVRLRGSMTGWTVTNDWDTDEIANVAFYVELEGDDGQLESTENIGLSRQKAITRDESSRAKDIVGTSAKGDFRCSWNLSTDGAFTHDTISLIQIATITMYFDYFVFT